MNNNNDVVLEEQEKKPRKKYKTTTSYSVQHRYKKKAMTAYSLTFHNVNDADVIEALTNTSNRTDLIRKAIRFYIANNKD